MKKLVFVFFACIVFFIGCKDTKKNSANGSGTERAQYRKISATEAHSMMSELTEYILLDVRTFDEYNAERIDGAILIPDNEIMKRAEKELPDKNITIFVYCRSGRRSKNASLQLADFGYLNVFDFGGITDWHYGTVRGSPYN